MKPTSCRRIARHASLTMRMSCDRTTEANAKYRSSARVANRCLPVEDRATTSTVCHRSCLLYHKVEGTRPPIDESKSSHFSRPVVQRNLRNHGWFGAHDRQGRHKRSFSHAIQKQHSRCRVSGCNHDRGVGRWRRGWRRRRQQLRGRGWNRSGRPWCPGRNESRLRRQSANDARFSGQSSTRLHRRIERNDERERAKQHSNSDGIEHDKFVGRHRVLTHCVYRRERCWQHAPDRLGRVSTAQIPENI